MTDGWYYAKGDDQFGPISETELKTLADSGELASTDMVWRDGMSAWQQAGRIRSLFPNSEASSGPTAPPPRKQSFDRKARDTVESVTKTSDEVSKKFWFLDLKFETFFTPKLVGFAFFAWMLIALLALAGSSVWLLLTYPALQAALGIIGDALVLLVATILVRVYFETLLIFFRVAEHLRHLKTIAEAASRIKE